MAFYVPTRASDAITLTDLFCGGGGSSTGAIQVPGVEVSLAINHSKPSVETHAANHPATRHDCADVSQVDPRRYPPTTIGWFSPECTNHTRAQGKKRGHGEFTGGLFAEDGTDEAAIRSRATMHDVARFAEAHRYRIIIVENVPDARWWGPEESPGAAFDAWIRSVKVWGPYEHRVIYLDSAHAHAYGLGARARRPRMYVVFWLAGDPRPDFDKWLRPYGDCAMHGRQLLMQAWKRTKISSPERPWGAYGVATGQYVYRCPRVECRNAIVEPIVRAAAEAIDFTRPAQIIGERAKPLAAATMRKIRSGWDVYRQQPYVIELRGGGSTHRSASEPLSTITAGGIHHGIVYGNHALLPYYGNSKAVSIAAPAPTITTRDRHGLIHYAPTVETTRYRMLHRKENAAGLEFPADYIWHGTVDQQQEMIGNAVSCNAGRDLVALAVDTLTGGTLDRHEPPALAGEVTG